MSSSEMTGPADGGDTSRVIMLVTHSRGDMSLTMMASGRASITPSGSALVTPRFLGRISPIVRISTVKPTAKIDMYSGPYTARKAAPATVAPAVLAMVLSVRMAAMGLSTWVRRAYSSSPDLLPDLRSRSMVDHEREYSTVSSSEQVKETATAMTTARTRVSMAKHPKDLMRRVALQNARRR